MNTIPLSDYCRRHTQTAAARLLGWTQGAVWQALQARREIYLVEHADGSISAFEMRHLTGERVDLRPDVFGAAPDGAPLREARSAAGIRTEPVRRRGDEPARAT